ncbi:hypothetical protein PhCBS80983_g03721 [Powellomyces hirtus]|uniref:Brl1/Brr6 domain-containing protein n=1 Tax=Powellomyces hirtus TaxID=109895 RepID=A0A507E2Q2_9FUNG|nr:hypothetical protein PhCBS80983_g03721 [Powellomyces hirtus]
MFRSTASPMDFRRSDHQVPWSVPLDSTTDRKSNPPGDGGVPGKIGGMAGGRDDASLACNKSPFSFSATSLSSLQITAKEPRRVIQPRRPKGSPTKKNLSGDLSKGESDVDSDDDMPVKGNARKRKKKDEAEYPGRTGLSSGQGGAFGAKALLLPYMISGYIQMIFSMLVIGMMLYLGVQFILTVRHDLDMKAEEYSLDIMQQVSECSKNYLENRCDPRTRVQFMQKACSEWELCMQRDPKEVGRLKVGAETLAEILNKLVEPLSYKTMAFGTVLLFGTLILTSSAFNLVKSRAATTANMASMSGFHPHAYHYMAPASPIPSPQSHHWSPSYGPPARYSNHDSISFSNRVSPKQLTFGSSPRRSRNHDYMDSD